MNKFKFLIVTLLLVLVCGLAACGPRAVNKNKGFVKVKEFLTEEYKISEGNVLAYENVYFIEITGNGTEENEELIGDVYYRIRLNYNGSRVGNQVLHYDASEDKVDWGGQSQYDLIFDAVKEGKLKGVRGEIKETGELK